MGNRRNEKQQKTIRTTVGHCINQETKNHSKQQQQETTETRNNSKQSKNDNKKRQEQGTANITVIKNTKKRQKH